METMYFKTSIRLVVVIILFALFVMGCTTPQTGPPQDSTPTISETALVLPTITITPPTPTFDISDYAFPTSIDPSKQYMFYLHGKIIEDQGIPAISPDFGEYEYGAILEKLSTQGFVVISEQRPVNTGVEYARRIVEQIISLRNAGVPAKNITVVGASKGAYLAIFVSHFLQNENVNFVFMAICTPDIVDELKQNHVLFYGNVLSIYDSVDEYAGSCQELFSLSEGKGLATHDEIVLQLSMGHGMLYQPLDDWIVPVVQWADRPGSQ